MWLSLPLSLNLVTVLLFFLTHAVVLSEYSGAVGGREVRSEHCITSRGEGGRDKSNIQSKNTCATCGASHIMNTVTVATILLARVCAVDIIVML